MDMKNVVVTGGAGFIGHHVVMQLVEKGNQVHVLDNFSTGSLENLMIKTHDGQLVLPFGLTVYESDIVHGPLPDIKKIDQVIHLAAPVSVPESLEDPLKYWDGIYVGTKNIIDWAYERGCKNFVAASTAAVYGDSQDLPLSEDSPVSPMSPYAEYKLEMEELLRAFNRPEMACTVLRFFNVFGEGQRDTGGYVSAVPIFLKQYESYQPITVTGDGQQTRDFVYVGDVARACQLALEDGWQHELPIYNVGSGQEYKIIELAEALGGEIKWIAERDEPKRSLSDISKIKAHLGWCANEDVLRWLKANK